MLLAREKINNAAVFICIAEVLITGHSQQKRDPAKIGL